MSKWYQALDDKSVSVCIHRVKFDIDLEKKKLLLNKIHKCIYKQREKDRKRGREKDRKRERIRKS